MRLDQPAWGFGLATVAGSVTLDVWYPRLDLGTPSEPAPAFVDVAPPALPGMYAAPVQTFIDSLAEPPKSTADAYLRLHLLSQRLIRPHQANLDGVFGLLANVAWTSAGPCPPERVDELRLIERAAGRHLAVYGVDKFPRMTDYVVPSGVRIADARSRAPRRAPRAGHQR
jgi:2,3,4,5-tetrahydropyridine-2-carboxylate N-succinyltransferase